MYALGRVNFEILRGERERERESIYAVKNVRREFIRDFLSLSLVLAETIIKLKQSPNKPKYTYNNVVTSSLNNYEITSSDKYSVLLFVEFLLKAVSCLKKKKKGKEKR